MITRTTLALGMAAALLSSVFAGSADAAKKPVAHHVTSHKVRGHASSSSSSNAAPSADHSADSLNAQSLTRAQTGQ